MKSTPLLGPAFALLWLPQLTGSQAWGASPDLERACRELITEHQACLMVFSKNPDGGKSHCDALAGPQLVECRRDEGAQSRGHGRSALLAPRTTPTALHTKQLPLHCDAVLTSPFGQRKDPFSRRLAFHAGVDLGAPRGTPVYARAAGMVTGADWAGGRGKQVVLDHGSGMTSAYGHLDRMMVEVGDSVAPGQLVGTVGRTGRATGFHLHYQVEQDGQPVDPLTHHSLAPELGREIDP